MRNGVIIGTYLMLEIYHERHLIICREITISLAKYFYKYVLHKHYQASMITETLLYVSGVE